MRSWRRSWSRSSGSCLPSRRIVKSYSVEFITAAFSSCHVVHEGSGAAGGFILIIPGVIDRELLEQAAFQQGELVVTLIAFVYFGIVGDIGKIAGDDGFIGFGYETIDRADGVVGFDVD